MADFLENVAERKCERAFLVGVQTAEMRAGEAEELLGELKELVGNLGIEVVDAVAVNLRVATPAMLLGSGKVAELVAEAKMLKADLIVIDAGLSPAQQRNWEKLSEMAVIDREEVILDIFAERAQTREAVLQVALARMEYSLPRLTRAWSHLSRQRGKGKMGGEGETQLEMDRRQVGDRITRLKRELAEVRLQRGVQRHKRQRVPVPTAAVVGYTNAGKSSLLNALTGASVLAENKLFATLDPTTRQLVLRGGRKLLVTDTVGFIRRLPHGLVEAFKATLEEVVVADFLVHVLDVTSESVGEHFATTLGVLGELGAGGKRMVVVFNKADVASEADLQRARELAPEGIFLSAKTGEGLEELVTRCVELTSEGFAEGEYFVPHGQYEVVSRLYAVGRVLEEKQEDEGVRLLVEVPVGRLAEFRKFRE